jgi:hypothetical protein
MLRPLYFPAKRSNPSRIRQQHLSIAWDLNFTAINLAEGAGAFWVPALRVPALRVPVRFGCRCVLGVGAFRVPVLPGLPVRI